VKIGLVASLLDGSCDPDSHNRMQPPDRDLDALPGHGIAYASLPLLGRGADQVSSRFVYHLRSITSDIRTKPKIQGPPLRCRNFVE
jgi:hypothetical protein